MEKYVRDLAAKIPGTTVMECDVQNDEQLDAAFAKAGEVFNGQLDISSIRSPLPRLVSWKILSSKRPAQDSHRS